MLASSSPLQNAFLGDADNAAFALDVAGGAGRAVVFDEYAHGFGSGGLGALPTAVEMGARARRRGRRGVDLVGGPPLRATRATERALPPPRVGYVDGLATVLSATADRGVVTQPIAPVARATRSSLCRCLGVPADATDAVVATAARAAGLPDGIVATALAPPTDGQSALAAGRAHAWLERERRSTV